MSDTRSSLGIRFEISQLEKLDSSVYALAAWRLLLNEVGLDNLARNTDLFEGDSAETLNGTEYVYILGVTTADSTLIGKSKSD